MSWIVVFVLWPLVVGVVVGMPLGWWMRGDYEAEMRFHRALDARRAMGRAAARCSEPATWEQRCMGVRPDGQ